MSFSLLLTTSKSFGVCLGFVIVIRVFFSSFSSLLPPPLSSSSAFSPRPDIIVIVYWAFKTIYLAICLSVCLPDCLAICNLSSLLRLPLFPRLCLITTFVSVTVRYKESNHFEIHLCIHLFSYSFFFPST